MRVLSVSVFLFGNREKSGRSSLERQLERYRPSCAPETDRRRGQPSYQTRHSRERRTPEEMRVEPRRHTQSFPLSFFSPFRPNPACRAQRNQALHRPTHPLPLFLPFPPSSYFPNWKMTLCAREDPKESEQRDKPHRLAAGVAFCVPFSFTFAIIYFFYFFAFARSVHLVFFPHYL